MTKSLVSQARFASVDVGGRICLASVRAGLGKAGIDRVHFIQFASLNSTICQCLNSKKKKKKIMLIDC